MRTAAVAARGALALLVLAAPACVSRSHETAAIAPASAWPGTLANAQSHAAAGRYAQADSLLSAFAAGHGADDDAREASYWRALFHLDPGNRNGQTREAMALLDGYLAGGVRRPHTGEALVLRRLSASIDSLDQIIRTSSRPGAPAERVVVDRARQDELEKENTRLKDQLERANAELERIRRRLSPTSPPATPPSRPPIG